MGEMQPSAALHDDTPAIRCKHPDMEAFAMRPVGYLLADRRRCNDPGDRSDVLAASHEMVLSICQNDLGKHDGGERSPARAAVLSRPGVWGGRSLRDG